MDGSVAKELKNAHAVFDNVREGTHFFFFFRSGVRIKLSMKREGLVRVYI